jgi:hypothetical protein
LEGGGGEKKVKKAVSNHARELLQDSEGLLCLNGAPIHEKRKACESARLRAVCEAVKNFTKFGVDTKSDKIKVEANQRASLPRAES